jgi:transmembrane sensor
MEQFDDLFDVSRLISGYLKNDLTGKEKGELQSWLNAKPENQAQFTKLISETKLKRDYVIYGQTDKVSAWARVVNETGYHKSKKPLLISLRIAAAASVLLILSTGIYFFVGKSNVAQQTEQNQNDIAPGSNKALLISRGKTFNINDIKNGLLTQYGNTAINKSANSQLVYTNGSGANNGTMVYDTLIVPRGGQYRLKLADGTLVYLNAETKLRYPEAFTGKERKVELISGEAYFEVVHNSKMPFSVATKTQLIEDIGTHFNVNAYSDEPAVRTTLLEGSVKLVKGSKAIILKPGQQAVNSFGVAITVKTADLDEVTAWKDGMFRFNGAPLGTIMKQVSRWYDVDVIYRDETVKGKSFFAMSTRFAKVSQLLNYLEETGDVKFDIDGRKITVSSK